MNRPTVESASTQISERPMPSVAELAAHTGVDRNRAVDFYRAVAMLVVAAGHWLGMVVILDSDGALDAGNLLDYSPGYGWVTWIGQVMPLFFFVGGFASATSLRSAERKGMRDQDWVATRLRRMVTPAAALAATWVIVLAAGASIGAFGIVSAGAIGAAIPLWFLANYTIDTALAPYTFRWFRSHPMRLLGTLGTLFAVAEMANLADIPILPQLNWIIGWLGFQIAGFAWQAGMLPTGRRLTALAGACWAAVIVAVTFGPYPAVMLHHGGLDISPTHPPSAAFLAFGFAYSFTAAALAPSVNQWLNRSRRGWTFTIGANAIAMSVYLWHMTAAVLVAGAMYVADLIPQVEAGTGAWWSTKAPVLLANLVVLTLIVMKVSPIERRALLGGTTTWRWGTPSMFVAAAALSVGIKLWSSPTITLVATGLAITLAVWRIALQQQRTDIDQSVDPQPV